MAYTEYVSPEFLKKDFPEEMNQLGRFVYYRTYSRFLPEKKRRETWRETVIRATNYNVGLEEQHFRKLGIPVNTEWLKQEAQALAKSMFHVRQFLSGRTLWVGGAETGVAYKYPLANYNCSFINIRSWKDLGDLFYLLLVGTGVGFKSTKKFSRELPPIRTNATILHKEYEPKMKWERLERSRLTINSDGTALIEVGDSKEGWVEALNLFLKVLTNINYMMIHTITIDYDSVRPKGERLMTFGGTASGHEPLKEMFEGFDKVLKNQIDPTLAPLEVVDTPFIGNVINVEETGYEDLEIEDTGYKPVFARVRPIHILDMGNLIGANVVVGGVRRTAEIFIFDADDYESMFAKYGINGLWKEEQFQRHERIKEKMIALGIPVPDWFDEVGKRNYDPNVNGDQPYNFGRSLNHRRMSNNSIAFTSKPTREMLHFVFEMMQMEGEPGFINLEQAARRRLKGMGIDNPSQELVEHVMALIGLNPCAEILLESYGVCNLTTVNLVQFVKKRGGKYVLDKKGLIEAQKMSARAGLRMTLADLELPHWDKVQKRDRLLGTSLTGVKDAMAMLGYTKEQERKLLKLLGDTARKEAERYARYLRVNVPLLVTTVKPEGTLSQVAGGVSSGLHWAHSPYYIRRIRINAADPLAKAVLALGWKVHAEIGTTRADGTPYMGVEELATPEAIADARTLVIDFPVASGSSETKDDVSAARQLETYFQFQEEYSDHNSSNTITVRPHEWAEVEQIVWDNWDNFTAVSFLALDGGTYQLTPYEAVTKEKYEELLASMKQLDPELLQQFEVSEEDLDNALEGMDGCEGGICPIR